MTDAISTFEGFFTGTWAPQKRTILNILIGYISIQRPLIAVMGPFMFLAGAFLVLGEFPSMTFVLVGFIAVYLLTASEHVIDDFIDIERDRLKWPKRALPTGLIKRSHAGVYAAVMAGGGMLLSFLFFNWQLVLIEVLALGLGAMYPFLRDNIGYLTLPPVPALIGVAGWVAVSPGTVFTTSTPWILYLFFVGWQCFHILSMPWAIKHQKTLFIRLAPKNTARLSLVFSVITMFLGLVLFYRAGFHYLFVVMLVLLSALYWFMAIRMIRTPLDDVVVFGAFRVATFYNTFLCVGIIFFSIMS